MRLTLLIFISFNCFALWEWGAGALIFNTDHYRGADQSKVHIIPVPYFKYKSKKIEAEPSFIRGTLIESGRFYLKVSVNAGLNVESKSNRAREGMPSLGYTYEVGPMVVIDLWKSIDKSRSFTFEMPFRKVYSTDLSYNHSAGYFAVPYLNYIFAATESSWNWGGEFSVAGMWASEGYHGHYYNVEEKFSTIGRPKYNAKSGYSGTQITLLVTKRIGHFYFTPFVRYDYLKGAAFIDSPLVKTSHYFLAGSGVFYVF